MKVFISKNYRHVNSGGDKAKTDVEAILLRNGWRNIGLPQGRSTNPVKAYLHTLASVLKGVMQLQRGDVLLVQYPLKKYYDFVVSCALKRGAKVVTLIHDLGCFRRKRLGVSEEITRLDKSSELLVHTREMASWLRKHGINVPIREIGLWDYLSDSVKDLEEEGKEGLTLVYAGDLRRRSNEWIYKFAQIDDTVQLRLYGDGFEGGSELSNVSWKGFLDSDRIVEECRGDYGVVWYEDKLDDITGPIGEYLPYCASHKTSLYLRAGLPVLIWEKAALAKTLVDLGVGISVAKLEGISEILKDITEEEYAAMRKRACEVGRKIGEGGYLAAALNGLSLPEQ